jgi:hypothetical protein
MEAAAVAAAPEAPQAHMQPDPGPAAANGGGGGDVEMTDAQPPAPASPLPPAAAATTTSDQPPAAGPPPDAAAAEPAGPSKPSPAPLAPRHNTSAPRQLQPAVAKRARRMLPPSTGPLMTLVIQDNGSIDLGGGVSFKIPPRYDDLARSGLVPRLEDVFMDEGLLKAGLSAPALQQLLEGARRRAAARAAHRAAPKRLLEVRRQPPLPADAAAAIAKSAAAAKAAAAAAAAVTGAAPAAAAGAGAAEAAQDPAALLEAAKAAADAAKEAVATAAAAVAAAGVEWAVEMDPVSHLPTEFGPTLPAQRASHDKLLNGLPAVGDKRTRRPFGAVAPASAAAAGSGGSGGGKESKRALLMADGSPSAAGGGSGGYGPDDSGGGGAFGRPPLPMSAAERADKVSCRRSLCVCCLRVLVLLKITCLAANGLQLRVW